MVREGGPPTLEAGCAAIPFPPAAASQLLARRAGTVRVGIRAEDLILTRGEPGGALEGRVELCEPLGGEALVHWSTPVGRLVSRVAGKAPAVGETATLHFANSSVHLFDPETERAIGNAGGPSSTTTTPANEGGRC